MTKHLGCWGSEPIINIAPKDSFQKIYSDFKFFLRYLCDMHMINITYIFKKYFINIICKYLLYKI